VAKKCIFCPEYKVFSLDQIQHNTSLSTTLSIFKAWWWLHYVMGMLVIGKVYGVFLNKNKRNRAKHRQNPRGKHGSVCFPTDTGIQLHLSAGQ
jgi:hypothetical protein